MARDAESRREDLVPLVEAGDTAEVVRYGNELSALPLTPGAPQDGAPLATAMAPQEAAPATAAATHPDGPPQPGAVVASPTAAAPPATAAPVSPGAPPPGQAGHPANPGVNSGPPSRALPPCSGGAPGAASSALAARRSAGEGRVSEAAAAIRPVPPGSIGQGSQVPPGEPEGEGGPSEAASSSAGIDAPGTRPARAEVAEGTPEPLQARAHSPAPAAGPGPGPGPGQPSQPGEAAPLPSGLGAQVGPAPSTAPPLAPPLAAQGAPVVLQAVPVPAVPVEVALRSLEGLSRFEIRLHPEELGRVDVTLDIRQDGEVKAALVVERPETLVRLQRESGHLERALEQAGLKGTDGGVTLSLRDPGQGGGEWGGRAGQDGGGDRSRPLAPYPSREPEGGTRAEGAPARLISARSAGIDVRV